MIATITARRDVPYVSASREQHVDQLPLSAVAIRTCPCAERERVPICMCVAMSIAAAIEAN